MKAGCLTKSLLEISEDGSCVYSHGVDKSIWYNEKRLWTAGGYIILSGNKVTQPTDTHVRSSNSGGLLPDIILLTQGYYQWGTRLNTM